MNIQMKQAVHAHQGRAAQYSTGGDVEKGGGEKRVRGSAHIDGSAEVRLDVSQLGCSRFECFRGELDLLSAR
jgi:hypothetical protein